MAGSPRLKVFSSDGEYIASVKYYEDAAALASMRGDGTQVRAGHGGTVLWHEGTEEFSAGESYDDAAQVMLERDQAHPSA